MSEGNVIRVIEDQPEAAAIEIPHEVGRDPSGTAGGQSWSLAGETVTFNNCIQDSCYSSHLTLTSCNSQLSSGGGDIENERICYLYSNDDGEYVYVDDNGDPLR